MRINSFVVAAAICTVTAVVSAQDQKAASQMPASAMNGSSNNTAMVTMTGCVTRANMSYANGRKDVNGRDVTTGGDSDRFLLSNAMPGGMAKPSSAMSDMKSKDRIATSSDAQGMGGARYMLDGQSADLRQHIGHQVEITGRVDSMMSMGGNGKDAAMPAGHDDMKKDGDMKMGGQTLHVQSVKMLAATCPASK